MHDNTILDNFSHDWNMDNWLTNRELIRDTLGIEGALLKHDKDDSVYFTLQPNTSNIVIEIKKDDIVELVPTNEIKTKDGTSYNLVRLNIKNNALLIRHEILIAKDFKQMNGGGGSEPHPEPGPRPSPSGG